MILWGRLSPDFVFWQEKHGDNVLFVVQQSRRHGADLSHPGINSSKPLPKVWPPVSSLHYFCLL